jgi:hypothetical protein
MLDPSKSLTLPSHVNFADLEFRVDGTDYLYQPRPFLRFCHHNEIAMTQLSINERGALIQRWYDLHLSAGGASDPVMENLRAEIAAEDRAQGGVQITPGHA